MHMYVQQLVKTRNTYTVSQPATRPCVKCELTVFPPKVPGTWRAAKRPRTQRKPEVYMVQSKNVFSGLRFDLYTQNYRST